MRGDARVGPCVVTSARLGFGALAVIAAYGCAPPPPPQAPPPPPPVVEERVDALPTTESEIGGLNEAKVKEAFAFASRKLGVCYDEGTRTRPYLGGEVRFVVRITKAGAARWVFAKDSTLGDRSTEDCMVAALKEMRWPKPIGGEGLAESAFTFDPSADERPPVAWSHGEVAAGLRKIKSVLTHCKADAHTGPLKVTVYVDTTGKAESIGVATADEKGEAAVPCVVDAVRTARFKSPGSFTAKGEAMIE